MATVNAPTAVVRDGHTTRIKWHRARRRAADPVFTATRIREGMSVGAGIEIDLVVHADRGFAVLHDLDVTRATTGSGHVRSLRADELRDDPERLVAHYGADPADRGTPPTAG